MKGFLNSFGLYNENIFLNVVINIINLEINSFENSRMNQINCMYNSIQSSVFLWYV